MKRLLILALAGALTSCAAGNTGAKFSVSHVAVGLPAFAAPAPAPIVLPRACSPDLRADAEPEPILPNDAFVPKPENAAAQAPSDRYLAFLRTYGDWGRRGWALAALGKAACS